MVSRQGRGKIVGGTMETTIIAATGIEKGARNVRR
jgi:hypothetical protein